MMENCKSSNLNAKIFLEYYPKMKITNHGCTHFTCMSDYEIIRNIHRERGCDSMPEWWRALCPFNDDVSLPLTSFGGVFTNERAYSCYVLHLQCMIKMRLRQFCHMSRLVLGARHASMHQKLLMTLILRTIGPIYWAAPDEIQSAITLFSQRIAKK
jgi:hypothetical protein